MVRATARKPAATVARIVCVLAAAGMAVVPLGFAQATALPAGGVTTPVLTPAAPTTTPASAACPDQVVPPPAVDASEQPMPGQTTPAPVPEPSVPAGGPAMAQCGYILPPGAPPLPTDLNYSSWVIQDLDTGDILAAKDPHARERPASLIKLLLAQVVARELNPATVVVGTQDDANQQGTRVGIGPGGQYTVTQLVDALLMASGNDAAHALAMQVGGMQTAVDKMNALAAQLGAADTRAASPSGLDAPGMATSAYDLSVFFKLDLATPLLATAMNTQRIPFPGYGPKPAFSVNNDNLLLRTYPGDFGGKNGYTHDALETFADAAEQNGHRIALVMMRGTTGLAGKWQNARELMNYGFALDNAHTEPVGHIVTGRAAASAAPPAATAAKPTPTHGSAQVATVPQTSMSTFGNVGLPLTILAGVAVVLIGLLYLRRQRAKKARAAAVARSAAAETVRVSIPPELGGRPVNGAKNGAITTNGATANGAANSSAATTRLPNTAPTPTARPRPGAPVGSSRPTVRTAVPRPNGAPLPGTPANGTPVNGVPVNGAPMNGVPVNGAPVNGTPVNGTPPGAPRPGGPRPPAGQRPNGVPNPEWPTAPEWPR